MIDEVRSPALVAFHVVRFVRRAKSGLRSLAEALNDSARAAAMLNSTSDPERRLEIARRFTAAPPPGV